LWIAGSGFFTLLNLIANTFWRTAPLGPTFSLPAVFIALVVHLRQGPGSSHGGSSGPRTCFSA